MTIGEFKIPLDFSDKSKSFYDANCLSQDKEIEMSIRNFITLLVNSSNNSFKPDSRFGFSLKNHRFENADSKDEIQKKKIRGKSDNFNYAKDLKETITQFESRLQNPHVEIDFDKEHSKGTIFISGLLVHTKEIIKLEKIEFHIWKE